MRKLWFMIMLMGLLAFSGTAIAKTYNVKITTGKSVAKITKFELPSYCGYNKKTDTLTVEWQRSNIKIKVSDLKVIKLAFHARLNSTNHDYSLIVLFKDGTKDEFKMCLFKRHQCFATGQSKYGAWKVKMMDVNQIEFLSSGVGSANTKAVVNIKTDNIQLKNGDTISGTVLTKTIKLKTSYGSLVFKSSDISLIDFEGDMDNVDRITLKVGDQLSGVILNEDIDVEMINGSKITVIKDKIKTVTFKE